MSHESVDVGKTSISQGELPHSRRPLVHIYLSSNKGLSLARPQVSDNTILKHKLQSFNEVAASERRQIGIICTVGSAPIRGYINLEAWDIMTGQPNPTP